MKRRNARRAEAESVVSALNPPAKTDEVPAIIEIEVKKGVNFPEPAIIAKMLGVITFPFQANARSLQKNYKKQAIARITGRCIKCGDQVAEDDYLCYFHRCCQMVQP